MRPAPSRVPLVRLPSRRLVATVVLALLAAVLVHRSSATAAATVARYGAVVEVTTAARDLTPGEVLTAGDLDAASWPVAFVPPGAVTDPPVGQVVTAFIGTGEVVVSARVGGDRRGVAALVPPGTRAVAVPTWEAALPVSVGDRVDVFAVGDGTALRSSLVASGAVVVHVDEDDAVTVAVGIDEVARVAAALTGGAVVLALVG